MVNDVHATASKDVVVVKLGGTTLADEHHILTGVAQVVHNQQHSFVLVHGGGKRLTEWLGRLGIESRFENGRRVTDDAAIEVALAVLGGVVNAELVAALEQLGVNAVGLTGIDGGLLRGERITDLGRVARVNGIRPNLIHTLLAGGTVPVVAPLVLDETGVICNVNADEAAAGLAGGLGARLVLLTDTDGVRGPDGERLPWIDDEEAGRLIEIGVITTGMLPKVRSGLDALRSGAIDVVIADGRVPGGLERALAAGDFGTRLRLASR
jgi:acetylglutamate kinase